MKKLLILFAFLLSALGHSQSNNNLGTNSLVLFNKSQAERDAYSAVAGRTRILYNDDTGRLEYRNGLGEWVTITQLSDVEGTMTGAQIADSLNTFLGTAHWQNDNQLLSVDTPNGRITIDNGNTIVLPTIRNADQTIAGDRSINIDNDDKLSFTDQGTTVLEIGGTNVNPSVAMDTIYPIANNRIKLMGALEPHILDTTAVVASTYPSSVLVHSLDNRPYYSNGTKWRQFLFQSDLPSPSQIAQDLDSFLGTADWRDGYQSISLSGDNNADLSISNRNTVTLPILATTNQTIASGTRTIQTGITATLNFTNGSGTSLMSWGGSFVRPFFTNGIQLNVEPTQDDDAATKLYVDTQIAGVSGGSYPSTAQKYYIIGASTNHTMSDADFAAGAEYKSVKYESIDTLQVAALTNATHGRIPFLVNPWDKDSTYIKKPVGVDFYVPGQMAAITGDGLIVKNRHTATGEQVDATTMLFSGELTVHTEVTAIEAFGFDYDFNANGLSLGSLASWSNSGGGLATEAAQATVGEQPTVIDESGIRAVQFDGVDDNLEITSQTDLNPVIGTDSGTIIVVVGADNGTDGTWFGDRNTVRNINIGLSNSATQTIIQIGEGAQIFDGITPSGAYIYEVSFDATTIDTYLNGSAEISGNTTIGSDQAQQPFNIGRRVNGDEPFDGSIRRILVKFGAQLTPAERTAIVAQLTSENL
jgi:hypothetical protein